MTGATGYVGGRLIPRLLLAGYRVRALVRDRERLQGRPWLAQVEVVEGNVLRPETLPAAVAGVTVAYYLVQNVHGSVDVQHCGMAGARNFAQAAWAAGVQRIICLCQLVSAGNRTSPQAALPAGEALRRFGPPVTELRAAVVTGSGSVSFEVVRSLAERMPVMFCPRWMYTRLQPVAIRDVLSYLIAVLVDESTSGQVIAIGGADTLTYAGMITTYARARGLRRLLIPVPATLARLSAYWVHWATPIPAAIALPMIEALRADLVVQDDTARRLFSQIQPLDYTTALLLAVERIEAGQVETAWSDALATSQGDAPVVPLSAVQHMATEGVIVEQRQRAVAAPPERVFQVFSELGGERGWFYANWTWSLRGMVDRLLGGVGMRRGRRHPNEILAGEALDFWRVEKVEENRLLRLRAEMRVPGRAWLEFQVQPQGGGAASLTQRAFFAPKGVAGLAYWYGLYPIHGLIFSGLIKEIARRAEQPQA